MSIVIEKAENYSVIKVNVEKVDSLCTPQLKSELVVLNTAGVKNIIIDLSQARYCDSSGLSAILIGNRLCTSAGGKLVLTGLNEPVKKVIAISKLDTILTIANTIEEAAKIF